MIHQSLHGYSEGHDLLAASVKLSREQRTLLSQMTDLSGPAPVRGFDGYLSGFMLPGNIYVLAKTWYATELPRPGCVWTHSLLLMPEILESRNILGLPRLFRRPQSRDHFGEYAAAVAAPEDLSGEPPISPDSIATIISRLYDNSEVRVCVETESAAEVERDFIAIWNQQWPALRREFTFTTGMLGSGTRAFDLQAVPSKNRRLFRESDGFALVDRVSETRPDAWAAVASIDATLTSEFPKLRRFLWSFGSDFREGRRTFRGLCEVFQALAETAPRVRAVATYECIASTLGMSTESAPLKAALFGGQPGPWTIDEPDALEVLALDGEQGILEESDAGLLTRSNALPLTALEALVMRLRDAPRSARVLAITDVFFERCDPPQIARMPIDMALQAVRRRPELTHFSAVWQRPEDEAVALLRAVIAAEQFGGAVAYALLSNGNLRLLYEARKAAPHAWVQGARAYADERRPEKEIEEFILGCLWNSRSDLRRELRAERFGQFLKLAAAVLDVSVREAHAFPLENADIGVELPDLHDAGAELQACGFLLMLGLVRPEPAASRWMAAGFSSVYLATQEQRLPWDLWRRFEPQLPWHLLEWDRCARLIEGAVTRFADRSWPPKEFFRTFSTDEEFDRAISVFVSMPRREYLYRLRSEADNVAGSATPFQSRRLSRASN